MEWDFVQLRGVYQQILNEASIGKLIGIERGAAQKLVRLKIGQMGCSPPFLLKGNWFCLAS